MVHEEGIRGILKYKDLKVASAEGTSTLKPIANSGQEWSLTHPTFLHPLPEVSGTFCFSYCLQEPSQL